jgi:nitrogen regulatory protein P-II 1
MKRIEVIVEPHKLDVVREALSAIGINDVTTSEVCGGEDLQAGISDVKLETVISAERATAVIRAFASQSWRDLLGDGKMLVYEVADPVSTRISESRDNAR